MTRYILVSVGSGILFAVMDGLINGNPLARRLSRVFEPIARGSPNIAAGIAIDLVYGFALSWIFIRLHDCLPGESGPVKGIVFGLMVWFFRVAMQTASQWMMFEIPAATILYTAACGLGEMIVLGLLYGLVLATAA